MMLIKAIILILLAMPMPMRCDKPKDKIGHSIEENIKRKIQEMDKEFSDHYDAQNIKWLVQNYHISDAFVMPPGWPLVTDKEGRRAYFRNDEKEGITGFLSGAGHIEVYRDLAVKIFHYTVTRNGAIMDRGRDICIWLGDCGSDGQWKVAYDLWSTS